MKLWDSRNDSAPLTYLSAHLSRVPWPHFGIPESIQAPQVHSIDWSYADPHSLVTASNDCTVKFHNVQGKRKKYWQLKTKTSKEKSSRHSPLPSPPAFLSGGPGGLMMICKKKTSKLWPDFVSRQEILNEDLCPDILFCNRFTPFGDGMVTVLVPHFGAHEHSLFLWNTKNLNTPVHTFVGHR